MAIGAAGGSDLGRGGTNDVARRAGSFALPVPTRRKDL